MSSTKFIFQIFKNLSRIRNNLIKSCWASQLIVHNVELTLIGWIDKAAVIKLDNLIWINDDNKIITILIEEERRRFKWGSGELNKLQRVVQKEEMTNQRFFSFLEHSGTFPLQIASLLIILIEFSEFLIYSSM